MMYINRKVNCVYIKFNLIMELQMGSQYKSAILEEHTIHAIKQWHANVKQKRKMDQSHHSSPNVLEDSTSSSTAVPVRRSNSGITTSPDVSSQRSHRRAPSFMEFASGEGGVGDDEHEIVEEFQPNANATQNQHEFDQTV